MSRRRCRSRRDAVGARVFNGRLHVLAPCSDGRVESELLREYAHSRRRPDAHPRGSLDLRDLADGWSPPRQPRLDTTTGLAGLGLPMSRVGRVRRNIPGMPSDAEVRQSGAKRCHLAPTPCLGDGVLLHAESAATRRRPGSPGASTRSRAGAPARITRDRHRPMYDCPRSSSAHAG